MEFSLFSQHKFYTKYHLFLPLRKQMVINLNYNFYILFYFLEKQEICLNNNHENIQNNRNIKISNDRYFINRLPDKNTGKLNMDGWMNNE